MLLLLLLLLLRRSQRMGYYNDDLKECDNDTHDNSWDSSNTTATATADATADATATADADATADASAATTTTADAMPLGPTIGKLLLLGMKRDAVLMILLGNDFYHQYVNATSNNTSNNTSNATSNVNDNDNDNKARCCPLDWARKKFMAGSVLLSSVSIILTLTIGTSLKTVLGLLPQSSVKERAIVRGMIRYQWQPGNGNDNDHVCTQILDTLPWAMKSLLVSAYQV